MSTADPFADLRTDDHQDGDGDESSFARIDLGPVVTGHYQQPVPDILQRDDGRALFYRGMVNEIHGDSNAGKSWIVLYATAQIIRAGGLVMYIDLEDVPGSIVARLRLLGLTDGQILGGLDYRRPTDAFELPAVTRLVADVQTGGHALVILDSLGEAFGLDGIDEDKDAQVDPWLRAVVRRLADAGAGVVIVDHITKAGDNPLHPSGSKRKRAAITGAMYYVEAVEPMAKGRAGRLRITCAKDRHGNYATKEVVADFVMGASTNGDAPMVRMYAPTVRPDGQSAEIEIVILAQRVVSAVRDSEIPLSKKACEEVVKGRANKKRAALDYALQAGCLDTTPGKHGAKILTYVRDMEVPE